ncbi:MAG: beta-ketoacyl synthase chain length factor [Gammaproteobacteria bacterium]|nr:beta-ketoacyl synthase chain length factor [Gammaproteobacteria bacterium]MCF6362452.1 beta-ketoacyl synthase chain length factor [Gammaproteobacteria bacterium]
MIKVYISAVGLAAPGLEGWAKGCRVLTGERPYLSQPLDRYKPRLLPANERRRATEVVRLAFRACEDALDNSNLDPGSLAGVFASSGGDYPIIDQICRALRQPQRAVSPTQFHNSVHNAAAGYWSIATGSRAPSISLAGYDGSFSAGLLEAATQVMLEGLPALLAVYDIPPPPPLLAERSILDPFAVTLILDAAPDDACLAALTLYSGTESEDESQMGEIALEAVRLGNPAARSLPLLRAIARCETRQLHFSTPNGGMLAVDLMPC